MEWSAAVTVDKAASAPVYRQVADVLRAAIVGGRLASGAAVGDERALAVRLGLSRMTVRKAISTVVAEGLVSRVRGRGSFVAAAQRPGGAGARVAGRLRIALLAPFAQGDLAGRQFYFRIFQGMQAAVCEWAQTPLMTAPAGSGSGDGAPGPTIELIYREVSAGPGGISAPEDVARVQQLVAALNADTSIDLVALLGIADRRLLAGLGSLAKPVVLIDSSWPEGGSPADKAGLENRICCQAAVEHLIQLGHRSIGLLNFVPDTQAAQTRREAYLAALAKYGLTAPTGGILAVELNGTAAFGAMRNVLAGPTAVSAATRPTAWFCASDELALGLMAAAREGGVNIPGQLSVVGFGDLGQFAWPPLTSVRVPIEELGRRAVCLCVRRWLQPAAPVETVVLPGELVVRGTSAPVRGG